MYGRPIRKLWLNEGLRDGLRKHAADIDSNMGEVIRGILEEIVEDPMNAEALSTAEQEGTLSISVEVPDDLWYDARAASMQSRNSLAGRVRKHLVLLLN